MISPLSVIKKTTVLFAGKCPPVIMSPNPGTQTPFTATCLQASAQTRAAAPRRGQPVCRTCRYAPCPSPPPSHPFLRTSHCLASGVPSPHHSFVCLQTVHVFEVLSRSPRRCRACWWRNDVCFTALASSFIILTSPWIRSIFPDELYIRTDACVCVCVHLCIRVDLTACRIRGARESQMPNTSRISVKMADRGATPGKVPNTSVSGHERMCARLLVNRTFTVRFSAGNLSGNRKKLRGKKFRARSNSTE